MKISVRAKPNKKKDAVYWQEIQNEKNESEKILIVEVNAPPVDGKANAKISELIAKFFGVRKSSVLLIKGECGRNKVFELTQVTENKSTKENFARA